MYAILLRIKSTSYKAKNSKGNGKELVALSQFRLRWLCVPLKLPHSSKKKESALSVFPSQELHFGMNSSLSKENVQNFKMLW